MEPIHVKEIDYGIACRIGNNIYINKDLKIFDIYLYSTILHHEFCHSDSLTWKDIKMDLTNSHLKKFKKQYYKFILTHPKSWTEFLPFGIYDKKIIIKTLLSLFYLILGGVICIQVFLF